MIHVIDLHFLNLSRAIASFLIITDAGPVLIETGPAASLPHLIEGIKNIGFQPEEVRHVLITHIHLDHAGAAWWFAEKGAKIYLHPKGVGHMEDPTKLMNSARRIYKDQMETLWGDMKPIEQGKLQGVGDGEMVKIGSINFQAWHTPGHAVHHIGWQYNNNLFTGDVAGVKIRNGPVVPPCPPPDINLEDWIDSIHKIKELPVDNLFLTHFGPVENKVTLLEQLINILKDWALWIKAKWEGGMDVHQIIPEFQDYVHTQLINAGVDENGVQQYEAANPSWMSVNGLIRYWEKVKK